MSDDSIPDLPEPYKPTIHFESDADIVLHSSDGVDFPVHQIFLRVASPFFRDMFALPTSSNSTDLPSIIMNEDAPTLDILLHWVYPTSVKPEIPSLSRAIELLEIAENKLLLECAVEPLRTIIGIFAAASLNPIKAWALAVRYNLPVVRRDAFLRCMKSTDKIFDVEVKELGGVTGLVLWKMMQTRKGLIKQAHDMIDAHHVHIAELKTAFNQKIAALNPLEELATSETIFEVCYLRLDLKSIFTIGIPSRSILRLALANMLRNAIE